MFTIDYYCSESLRLSRPVSPGKEKGDGVVSSWDAGRGFLFFFFSYTSSFNTVEVKESGVW